MNDQAGDSLPSTFDDGDVYDLVGKDITFTYFPSLKIIGVPQNTRVLEGEIPHPETGLPMLRRGMSE